MEGQLGIGLFHAVGWWSQAPRDVLGVCRVKQRSLTLFSFHLPGFDSSNHQSRKVPDDVRIGTCRYSRTFVQDVTPESFKISALFAVQHCIKQLSIGDQIHLFCLRLGYFGFALI
jgi:hypothetical protein